MKFYYVDRLEDGQIIVEGDSGVALCGYPDKVVPMLIAIEKKSALV